MTQAVKIGNNSISVLRKFLSDHLPKSIFLVTGKDSYYSSGAHHKLEPILSAYKYYRFFDFEENPKVEDAERGIKIFRQKKCDLIIAVGGGSVIDMAKLINIFHSKEDELSPYILSAATNSDVVPFVVLPTTSGTGSEATHFAVVYIDNKKYSVADNLLLPVLVLIDPSLTFSASSYLTAVTGLDAFAQAIESFWSINSTGKSQSYALQAAKIIWDNLPIAANENTPDAKYKMSRASNLAGKAINISKTTAPHALSYAFTSYFNLAHGHAVSLFLPFFIDYHTTVNEENCLDIRGANWVKGCMIRIAQALGVEIEQLARETVRFINRCNISIDYEEISISALQFKQIIGNFNNERLKNNPLIVDAEILNSLYYSKYNRSGIL